MGCKLLQGEAELGVMRTGLKQTTRRLHHRERGVGRLQGSRWRDRRKKKKICGQPVGWNETGTRTYLEDYSLAMIARGV
jgi:hypothetical protein